MYHEAGYNRAVISFEYDFSEFYLIGQGPRAERTLDLVKDLGWDAQKVEGYRSKGPDSSICTATGKPMLGVHLNSGLMYLATASRQLERLDLKESVRFAATSGVIQWMDGLSIWAGSRRDGAHVT
ncbi:hypothetical protein CNYM01_11214 [Colletotrichum nymphaeae SA-01]|uniref:Uncharacterized protein n=1 Tax=Colletotrichum nymphaeae SA-01 TaxID=1460502 RepID=A0A135U8U5_9PEZI|nr:hypothetical protein CNYM01_11214 [Colletotrichum nymphaeae SA-01]